ncbi:MAG: hypothetical protein ABJA74_01210 [Lapillicoccus sp.]
MTNIHRHDCGPRGPMNNQINAAAKKPTPRPLCISPAALDRSRSGHVSATRVAPVLHSEPSAIPVRNRQQGERPPAPGQGCEPREQGVGAYRQEQCPASAVGVGEDPTDDTPDAETQQRQGDGRAGEERDAGVVRGG